MPYAELLQQLLHCFPRPLDDVDTDGALAAGLSALLRGEGRDPVDLSAAARQRADRVRFPETIRSEEETLRVLAKHIGRPTVASRPGAQSNFVAPATSPSIVAFALAALHQANLVEPALSGGFRTAETLMLRLASELAGYDPARSGGLFTFGGTGTLLYGCRLGLERACRARSAGPELRHRAKIIASRAAHYSVATVAEWLGIGRGNLLSIPTDRLGTLSLSALEDALHAECSAGTPIAAIVATIGTTDAFGIDELEAIVEIRNRVAAEYRLIYLPHVHADAVSGWVWRVFADYDFVGNPLGYPAETLGALRDVAKKVSPLGLADSVGMDFHKTGYVPCLSSVFLVQDRADLEGIARPPDVMPYLDCPEPFEPASFSLECSRPGAGALAALANFHLLGKQGYRVLIGHAVEMALELRKQLTACPGWVVLNAGTGGPVSLLRAYPEPVGGVHSYQQELHDPSGSCRVAVHNRFNRRLYDRIRARCEVHRIPPLAWTQRGGEPAYPSAPAIAALKSCILSPWIDRNTVASTVNLITACREEILAEEGANR